MAKKHYALVEKEGCGSLRITRQEPTLTSSHLGSLRAKENSDARVRLELEQIYQTYADLYPNPRLIEEKRQRETLLQATRAASTFQQQELEKAANKKARRGFFTFLFGTREDPPSKTQQSNKEGSNNACDADDDRIKYVEVPNEHDDGGLCGTLQSLDVSCIPPEVYTVARSHLSSTRTRRDHPNAVRWGPRSRFLTQEQTPQTSSSMYVVVGLGEIAEFGGSTNPNPESPSSSRTLHTSDRESLISYANESQEFDLSAVRATVLSPNCIAVSWGFLDGITVFYRRRILLDETDKVMEEGWEAVWWLGPSGPVLENLTNDAHDLFHDNAEQPGSPLLKVSDCVALHVEAPVVTGQHHEGIPVVAILAISRLGGYIELIPLSTALWKGPILERDYQSTKTNEYNYQKRQQTQYRHYAGDKRIGCPRNTLALTTFDYHIDIQTLEVHRTKVNSETIWDNEKYPDGPPGEFLLAVSGVSGKDGYGEIVTFWGISTIFSPEEETDRDIQFELHSSLMEAIHSSTGAPISVFATKEIMKCWRTPRQVELKEEDTSCTSDGDNDDNIAETKPLGPITTLSASAPIVSMKFSNADGKSGPFFSVLDWNGGMRIFDCSILCRLVSQDLTDHEYGQYQNLKEDAQDGHQIPFNLVETLIRRSCVTRALQKTTKTPTIGNFHWLESIDLGANGAIPSIACLLNHCNKLAIVTFDTTQDGAVARAQDSPKSSVITVPLPSSRAAMAAIMDNSLSFVSSNLVTSKSSQTSASTQVLKFFVMEQLQPVAIVEALARDSKLEEAIQSASKLSKYEQNELREVIVECHKRLWETKRDVKSLNATKDNSYIVQEVLSICSSNNREGDTFVLKDLRSMLKLALEACSSERERSACVRDKFVRLGTYELLCQYYESSPSLEQFRAEFLGLNVTELAFQLAGRGDIPALSIVLFRHRLDVRSNLLDILATLPLALNSISFSHLLPVIRGADVSDLFLDATIEDISEVPWSHMPQFMLDRHHVAIVSDRSDELIVLEHNQECFGGLEGKKLSEDSVVPWFMKRAKQMQGFVGQMDDVIRFCEFGIKSTTPDALGDPPYQVQELHSICRTALSLQRMLLDEVVPIDGDGIDTDDLMDMDLADMLDLVLDGGATAPVVRHRIQAYVKPLIMEISLASSSEDLDDALVAYCLKEAKKASESQVHGASNVLAIALAIAENSRSSLSVKNRLVTSEKNLVRLILSVVKEIFGSFEIDDASIQEKQKVLQSIWSLYETLPENVDRETEAAIHTFYQDLVGTDILSRWPRCQPFKFFNARQLEKEIEIKDETKNGEEEAYVLSLCKSFMGAMREVGSTQDRISLLQDLLCDVSSLNTIVLNNSVDVSTILCDRLIPLFLEEGAFELVVAYLDDEEMKVEKGHITRLVVDYLEDAMFSEVEDSSRIMKAIRCQDILEPVLPEIKQLCQSNRRYLDATHFVSTVLFDGHLKGSLKPSDFKEMTALDAVETILKEVPECIICRCPQWGDADFSRNANKALRQAFASSGGMAEEYSTEELPELPAGAVFHLATILGLENNVSAVVVKSRVIYYALEIGFHGAAAAIARTLLQDRDFQSSNNSDLDFVRLTSIAEVVSNEAYLDSITKKELCENVLRRFEPTISSQNFPAFDKIVQVSTSMDHLNSRFEQNHHEMPPTRREILYSRPIARLHLHTFHEYNRDVHALLKDLSSQANQGVVHDSLVDALSRFTIYWCIHDSKTLKTDMNLRYKADALQNLMLGCGLILQIPSNFTASNSVNELRDIAATQAAEVATEERFEGAHAMIEPNPDILKHLVERGFSDNGARRAVIMTGNAGYSEALAWAVQHTMDPDFNQPLLMLRSSKRKFIDEGSMQTLQKSLIALADVVDNPVARSAFLRRIGIGGQGVDQQKESINTLPPIPMKKSAPVETDPVEKNRRRPPPPPRRVAKETTKIESVPKPKKPLPIVSSESGKPAVEHAGVGNGVRNPLSHDMTKSRTNGSNHLMKASHLRSKAQATPAANGVTNSSLPLDSLSKATQRKEEMVVRAASIQATKTENPLSKPAPNGVGKARMAPAVTTKTARTTTKVRREALLHPATAAMGEKQGEKDYKTTTETGKTLSTSATARREELRKRGKEALDRMRSSRSGGSKPSVNDSENRRRLIEEGRELLRQSKPALSSKMPVAPSKSKPVSTKPILSLKSSKPKTVPPAPPPRPKLSQPASSITNPKPASTPTTEDTNGHSKATKIAMDENEDDAGWDFDDFDDF